MFIYARDHKTLVKLQTGAPNWLRIVTMNAFPIRTLFDTNIMTDYEPVGKSSSFMEPDEKSVASLLDDLPTAVFSRPQGRSLTEWTIDDRFRHWFT